MNYPGGKNADGVWQRIINQMPPHQVYVEPFLGSGAVLRRKRPAKWSIGIDRDAAAIAAFGEAVPKAERPAGELLCCDGVDWLQHFGESFDGRELVYADPPYLPETRSRPEAAIYRFELDRAGHRRLLRVLGRLPCAVLLSGYRSKLYDQMLKGWRRLDFKVMTRGGPKVQSLWANYPAPEVLHDSRFVGGGFRQRWNLTRQKRRWLARLEKMSPLQRQALLEAISEAGLADFGDGRPTPLLARPGYLAADPPTPKPARVDRQREGLQRRKRRGALAGEKKEGPTR